MLFRRRIRAFQNLGVKMALIVFVPIPTIAPLIPDTACSFLPLLSLVTHANKMTPPNGDD